MKNGACTDEGLTKPTYSVGGDVYMSKLATSKFVLSPAGNGFACYRDNEAAAAGAVPVLDGYLSGGKHLFDDTFPAVHIPDCSRGPWDNPKYCNPEAITKDFLEAEYAKLEARRKELNVAKVYWPYWLYHIFKQVPSPPGAAFSPPLESNR
jgi:hypothetical protein